MGTAIASFAFVLVLSGPVIDRSNFPQTAAPPKPRVVATLQVTSVKQLAALASALQEKPTMRGGLGGPQFSITPEAFVFSQGKLPVLGDDFVGSKQHPILIPLARFIQLEDLHAFLAEQPGNDMKLWEDYFLKAHALLGELSLQDINSGTLNGEALTVRLWQDDARIAELFETAAARFAASRNLKYQRPVGFELARHTVQVSFQKSPPDGRLWVIPATLYAPDGSLDDLWREITDQETPQLGGRYFYKVRWSDGTTTLPSLIVVERAGQVFVIRK